MTRQRATIWIITAVFTLHALSCNIRHESKVLVKDVNNPKEMIIRAVTRDGSSIMFNADGGWLSPDSNIIVGHDVTGTYRQLPFDSLLYVHAMQTDRFTSSAVTALLGVGILAAVGIVLVAASSCPFIYSNDGTTYVFDAEPYGGSVSEGLKKTDYSRLEHLRAVDGRYELMMRNEMEETQHTDEISLLVVDHSHGTLAVPDASGNIHLTTNPVSPSRAVDENGRDLRGLVAAPDSATWESRLPLDSAQRPKEMRNHLDFTFAKPAGVTTGHLVVTMGTALWGSTMIKGMLELRGDQMDAWYHGVDNGGKELYELFRFNEREELFFLKVKVKERGGWNTRGYIHGGGPFMIEDRMIDLDLSGVEGDSVMIGLDPPIGYWSLDRLAMAFDATPAAPAIELHVTSAIDHDGSDRTAELQRIDRRYHLMSKVGDWTKVTFDAPPPPAQGMERSIFLRTNGWYEIHLPKNTAEQRELLDRLTHTPGAIVQYSIDEYLRRRSTGVVNP